MEPIYIAAIISFAVGLFGYIIIRFWLLPIIRYIRVKGRLAAVIRNLLYTLHTEALQHTQDEQIKGQQVSVRRHSSDLVSIYQNELPYWYRLYLESQKEKPLDAAESSMRLANTRKPEHAFRQADDIKHLLRLK